MKFIFIAVQMLGCLKEFYDKQGRLFLPPFQLGEALPHKLHEAYAKEREASKQKLADSTSQYPSETDDKVDSYLSVEQSPASTEVKHLADDRVGLPEQPFDDSCLRITHETGIVLPQNLDLKNSPVAAAVVESLASHIGIDLSPEAREAENRMGVAILIHGPSSSGKTTQAKALGDVYGAAVLQLDTVLIEAISSASTSAGRKAREYCIQAMVAKSVESSEAPPPSNTAGGKKKEKEQIIVKEHPPEIPLPPILVTPFEVDPHEDKEYAVLGGSLNPTHVPEDVIAEVLSTRLQEEDCRKGVIIDGIDSQFTISYQMSTAIILRAFSNRKHIYAVHLGMELHVIKDRLEEVEQLKFCKLREENEKKREAERMEELRVENLLHLDEDEYEALSDEQKEEVDAICLQRKKEMREKRRIQKEERERQERERKEEEERLKELEKAKKKGKKGAQKAGGQPPKTLGMQAPGGAGLSRPESVSSGINPQASGVLGGFIATASGVSMSSMDSPNTAGTPRHRIKRKGSAKNCILMESEEEATCKLEKMYSHYKSGLEGFRGFLDDWDRQKGKPHKVPEVEELKPTPTRKSRALKQHKEQETTVVVAHEVEDSREGVGVPIIEIRASDPVEDITRLILAADLPKPEDILQGLGLGPDGLPIPDSFTFQVCPLPLKRREHEEISDVYSFIISSPDDP